MVTVTERLPLRTELHRKAALGVALPEVVQEALEAAHQEALEGLKVHPASMERLRVDLKVDSEAGHKEVLAVAPLLANMAHPKARAALVRLASTELLKVDLVG